MGGFAAKFGLTVSEVVLPPVCLVCRRRLAASRDRRLWTCAACRGRLTVAYPYLFCSICGGRLPGGRVLCHPQYGFPVCAPLDYGSETASALIRVFKYRSGRVAVRLLAQVISGGLDIAVQNSPPAEKFEIRNSILVPIPLHPRRERKRGFNQAAALAGELKRGGRLADVPVLENALVKIKGTPSQAKAKSREERLENIRGSFFLRRPDVTRGRDVILVDDVFTTGATLREAARVLRASGARVVLGLAAARA